MDDTNDRTEPRVPRTTTTGDDEQDLRRPGDGAVQDADRADPRDPDPNLAGHREDDDLLPGAGEEPEGDDDDLGKIERPAGHLTDRPYGDT
jgi:hypothetical protein